MVVLIGRRRIRPPAGAHFVAMKPACRDVHQLAGVRLSAVQLCFTVMPYGWCTDMPAFDPLAAQLVTSSTPVCCVTFAASGPAPWGGGGGQHWGASNGPVKACTRLDLAT